MKEHWGTDFACDVAQSCAISASGDFAVLGTEGGLIERFNLQSGLSRGAYEDPAVGSSCAHNASVNGLATDSTNTLLTSGGYDGLLKVSCLALLFVLSSGVLHPVIGLTSSQSSLS